MYKVARKALASGGDTVTELCRQNSYIYLLSEVFVVSPFDADTLSEPFRIPCTYCLTKTKKFSYLRSFCSDIKCQVVFEPYLMLEFYVTR